MASYYYRLRLEAPERQLVQALPLQGAQVPALVFPPMMEKVRVLQEVQVMAPLPLIQLVVVVYWDPW